MSKRSAQLDSGRAKPAAVPVGQSLPTLLGKSLVLMLAIVGCESEECVDHRDCPPAQDCLDGVCKLRDPVGNGSNRDATVDAGPRDVDAAVDGGQAVDGGHPDGGDAGVETDSGQLLDGGLFDATPDATVPDVAPSVLPNAGFIWAAELRAFEGTVPGSHHIAYGALENREQVTYDFRTQPVADGENGCTLTVTRQLSGTVAGFVATRIDVLPGPQPFAPFQMFPVGGGRFEPLADPINQMFEKSINTNYRIVSDQNPGELTTTQYLGVVAPMFMFESTPPLNEQLDLTSDTLITWIAAQPSPGTVTVEVSDQDREVVLTCVADDDGEYTLPATTAAAWFGELPTSPAVLEIRYDSMRTDPVSIINGGSLMVTFRASQGVRYKVIL